MALRRARRGQDGALHETARQTSGVSGATL